MFPVPAVPIIRSTVLQLAFTGITYIMFDREMYGNVHFKGCPESGGWSHHRGWVPTEPPFKLQPEDGLMKAKTLQLLCSFN
jgi:hypothetical protein